MSDLPIRFVAHYECDCGESFEMWNAKLPHVRIYCDECGERTTFYFKYLEHRIWEWERVEKMWAKEGGLTLPDESND